MTAIGSRVWVIPEGYTALQRARGSRAGPAIPKYASVISSDVPVVVQHSRLDSRQAENALMTPIAYPGP